LLVEYDGYGVCLREYIYIGAKMVAEYQPQMGKYYYYTTDQIGSTRIVTDDVGNMVYAAAHDPYGGMQQTWVNTFNPELKFSGKEQDAESALYYFGARYYDPTLYRFLSPDPVIPTDRALYNPQRWNLYGYCGNNPVNFIEFNGAYYIPFIVFPQIKITYSFRVLYLFRYAYEDNATRGVLMSDDQVIFGYTLELPWKNNEPFKSCIKEGIYKIWTDGPEIIRLEDKNNRTGVMIHKANRVDQLQGCIAHGWRWNSRGNLVSSRDAVRNLVDYINANSEVTISIGIVWEFDFTMWYLNIKNVKPWWLLQPVVTVEWTIVKVI